MTRAKIGLLSSYLSLEDMWITTCNVVALGKISSHLSPYIMSHVVNYVDFFQSIYNDPDPGLGALEGQRVLRFVNWRI